MADAPEEERAELSMPARAHEDQVVISGIGLIDDHRDQRQIGVDGTDELLGLGERERRDLRQGLPQLGADAVVGPVNLAGATDDPAPLAEVEITRSRQRSGSQI